MISPFPTALDIGLEVFTNNQGPYWDISLNENLPQPVIDLPIPAALPGEAPRSQTGELFDFHTTAASAARGDQFAEQPIAEPMIPTRGVI
jgi:hypothetical protein